MSEIKQKKKQEEEIAAFLDDWKEKLNRAMEEHSYFRNKASEWDLQYMGGRADIEEKPLYISNRSQSNAEDKRENITMQLIESSIDVTIPRPTVEAIEAEDGQENRKMIEGMLTYMSESPNLERIVTENERITKKNSFSVLKLHYNPDYDGHSYKGRLEIDNPHPTNIIPQPGIKHIKDMDYIFHIRCSFNY